MHKTITSFALLMLLFLAGCGQRLKQEELERDPCLLVTPAEVASVSGIQVTASKLGPMYPADSTIGCVYKPDPDHFAAFLIFVITDATLKKGHQPVSAAYYYDQEKSTYLEIQKEIPKNKIENIDNLGDKAYFWNDQTYLRIRVLENKIYYEFSTNGIDRGGISNEALIELVKIALQRTP
jgi:hypothetical protein